MRSEGTTNDGACIPRSEACSKGCNASAYTAYSYSMSREKNLSLAITMSRFCALDGRDYSLRCTKHDTTCMSSSSAAIMHENAHAYSSSISRRKKPQCSLEGAALRFCALDGGDADAHAAYSSSMSAKNPKVAQQRESGMTCTSRQKPALMMH